MKRTEESIFVYEMPLRVSPKAAREIEHRFEVARKLYNTILAEGLRRYDLMRQSKMYQHLMSERKSFHKDGNSSLKGMVQFSSAKERNQAWSDLRKQYELSGTYALSGFATQCSRDSAEWAKGHTIGASLVQSVMERAWRALERYMYHPKFCPNKPFERTKFCCRPKFKSKRFPLTSLQARNAKDYLRIVDKHLYWGEELKLPLVFHKNDVLEQHALQCEVRYVRLVQKEIRGKIRYFVQLTVRGESIRKFSRLPQEIVGLKVSSSAVVAASENGIQTPLAHEANAYYHRVSEQRKMVERAIDRSRRAMNRRNYDEKGVNKKGSHCWAISERCKSLLQVRKEMFRIENVLRHHETGKVANRILQEGTHIITEDHDFRFDARKVGQNVRLHAPGALVEKLVRRAKEYGGEVTKIPVEYRSICLGCGKNAMNKDASKCNECGYKPNMPKDIYYAMVLRQAHDELIKKFASPGAAPGGSSPEDAVA